MRKDSSARTPVAQATISMSMSTLEPEPTFVEKRPV
jgi:hypothetical protein